MSMPPDAAGELEEVGTTHLESIGLKTYRSADEVGTEEKYWEGSIRRVTVNAYERAPRARAACVAHYGVRCSVCDLDFGESYGDAARGFIKFIISGSYPVFVTATLSIQLRIYGQFARIVIR